jgi:hypothetical protein
LITGWCVIFFALGGFNLLNHGLEVMRAPAGRSVLSLVLTLTAFLSYIGLWRMKRWGPVLYLAGLAIGTTLFFLVPPANASVLMDRPVFWVMLVGWPAIYCSVVLPHWRLLR